MSKNFTTQNQHNLQCLDLKGFISMARNSLVIDFNLIQRTAMKKIMTSIALVCGLIGASHASTVDLLTNGGFETGTLAGWTVNHTTGNSFYAMADGGTTPITNHSTANLANGGSYVAVSDQNQPGGEELLQSFTVLSGLTSLILSFDWFDKSYAAFSGTTISSASQSGRVDILYSGAAPYDTGSGVEQNLLSNVGIVDSTTTAAGWVHETFDLSALAAGTYAIRFGTGIKSSFENLGVDNVSLLATSADAAIPEPASLALFGLGLAGLSLVRRRKTGSRQAS